MIDPAHCERVDAICAKAKTLSLDQRERFLNEACACDVGLRTDVERRLSSTSPNDAPGEGFNPIDSIAVEAVTIPQESNNPEEIAQVRAEHTLSSMYGIYPFAEQQISGKPIDQYCDDLRLDMRCRIKLFIQASNTVLVAHQHGVIHRNLKAGNILVTAEGCPRVTNIRPGGLSQTGSSDDAGTVAAKLTPAQMDESASILEYISPEQVKGEPATTSSDIYALGVILYRLFTSRWPYRVTQKVESEILQAICEQLPERPSRAVSAHPGEMPQDAVGKSISCFPTPDQVANERGMTPRRLQAILKGDLDSIVLMTLQKEPERRYPSVAHLCDDLNRYLDRLPVLARRQFPAYRSTKFIRRHAIAVGTGLIAFLALLTGSITLTRGLITVRRDHAGTEKSLQQARQVLDETVTRISDDRLLNQPALLPFRQSLLQDVQRFYENYVHQQSADPKARVELASAQTHLAKIMSLTGSTTKAIDTYRQAIPLWESLLTREPENLEYQAKLAQTLSEFGLVLLPQPDRLHEASDILLRAQGLYERLISAQPGLESHHLRLGLNLVNIAEIKAREGKLDDAISLAENAAKTISQLSVDQSQSPEQGIALATAFAALGRFWAQDPEALPTAIANYEYAIKSREAVTRQQPQLVDQLYELAIELSKLSSLYQDTGQPEPARQNLRRALHAYERVVSLCPEVPQYEESLAAICNTVSDVERRRSDQTEALELASKSRDLFARLTAKYPDNLPYRRGLAQSYNNLGRVQSLRVETQPALRSFQRATDLYESLDQPDARDSYKLACNVALCIPLITRKNGVQAAPQDLSNADRLYAQLYGDRAIESLRRSFKDGFLNAQILHDETDLDAIRTRPDFNTLVKEIEETQAPQAK